MPTLQKIKPYFKPSKNREPFTFRFAKIIGLGLGLLFTTSVISQTSTGLRIKQNAQSQTIESAASSTVSSLYEDHGSQSPFDAVKGKKEDFSKRDLYSKHYVNEDGSFTALIGAGPIHYESNGQFLDIDHKIQNNSNTNYPFVNKTRRQSLLQRTFWEY